MSTISSSQAPNLQQIDLTKLNLQQLTMFKQQLDKELQSFQQSLQTLKMAQTKFQESGQCLDKVSVENEGKEILVPLTESMYVPGRFAKNNSVVIDIGTGYFVGKSIEEAKVYFQRRVAFVTSQIEKVQLIGLEKTKIQEATIEVIGMKIQQQMNKEDAQASA